MKKQLMIVGIIVILITVGLSGCTNNNDNNYNTNSSNNVNTNNSNNGNTNIPQSIYVEISNLNVTTNWTDGQYLGLKGSHAGFYYDYPKDLGYMGYAYYEVTGVVKNIATKPIDYIGFKVNFYGSTGNLIIYGIAHVENLNVGDSQHFSTTIDERTIDNFDEISNYEVKISSVSFQ